MRALLVGGRLIIVSFGARVRVPPPLTATRYEMNCALS
jgi:hypothetical protein